MSKTTLSKTPLRRTVRREYRTGDQIGFKTKSFTQSDGPTYHPALDVVTGEWSCTCKAAQYRPHTPCKHALRAAQNAVRAGDAEPSFLKRMGLTCCYICLSTDNLNAMCHDDGAPMHDVYVCGPCAEQLRFDARLREIEQLRLFAAHLDAKGEGSRADYTRRKADHFERLLNAEVEETTQ